MNTILTSPDNVLAFRLSGAVEKQDIIAVKKALETKMKAHEIVGLAMDLTGFEDITAGAFKEDIKFETNLLGKLGKFPKVAMVTDKQWLARVAQGAGKLIPRTEVRAYSVGEMDQAIRFASNLPEIEKVKPSIRFIETADPKLIAFEYDGKLTEKDFEWFADPFMKAIEAQDEVDMLVRIKDFHGFELSMLKDSAVFKLKKAAMKKLRRYAVVGAPMWIAGMSTLVNPFMSAEVRTFDHDEEAKAWAWLKS